VDGGQQPIDLQEWMSMNGIERRDREVFPRSGIAPKNRNAASLNDSPQFAELARLEKSIESASRTAWGRIAAPQTKVSYACRPGSVRGVRSTESKRALSRMIG